jgi:hypothetical protein
MNSSQSDYSARLDMINRLAYATVPNPQAYLAQRSELWERVRLGLASSGLRALGSWRTGQFHYSAANASSVSDVDAWSGGQLHHDEATLSVTDQHSQGDALRLSIHPYNYELMMTLRAQKVLAILNLARQQAQPALRRYQLHKGFLVMCRSDREETYADTAERVGELGLYALATKLGIRTKAEAHADDELTRRLVAEICTFAGLQATAWSRLRVALKRVGATLLSDPDLTIHPGFREYLWVKFVEGD